MKPMGKMIDRVSFRAECSERSERNAARDLANCTGRSLRDSSLRCAGRFPSKAPDSAPLRMTRLFHSHSVMQCSIRPLRRRDGAALILALWALMLMAGAVFAWVKFID